MNRVDSAQVWPLTWERNADGDVYIGGCRIADLAAEYGTPLFIYDEADFRQRCHIFAEAFGAKNVHYAGKSFLSIRIAQWLKEEGLALDVCSLGELYIAMQADFSPENITLHGNNKSISELKFALESAVGVIVIDSFQEIERLNRLAGELGIVQNVYLRLTTGIIAHTHEFISTAHEDQKFVNLYDYGNLLTVNADSLK